MTECHVGEAGSDVVIGHVVLTLLDLVAGDRRLAPRHPDGPVWPLRTSGRGRGAAQPPWPPGAVEPPPPLPVPAAKMTQLDAVEGKG